MSPELRRRLSALERRATPRPTGRCIDPALMTDDELEFLESLTWIEGGRTIDASCLTEEQCDRVEAIVSRFIEKAA